MATGSKRLNDLSGREWLPSTRSAFVDGIRDPNKILSWDSLSASFTVMSKATPRDARKKEHPATFPEEDARRLIRMFTTEGQSVLDPFMGTGSTAVACVHEKRACVGFELYDRWTQVAIERSGEIQKSDSYPVGIQTKDALIGVQELKTESQDFILTSPPYWGILRKKDHKAKSERLDRGLDTDYGSDARDLGQIEHYDDFLESLTDHFRQWHRVLRNKAYAAVVVSDFRHRSRYYPFHADLGGCLEDARFTLQGIVVIVQDSKRLYPYGYPTTYVPNVCNQFVVIARKIK